nr:MAG TPA: hypothetical protein [Caudoviricetes sp.]
MRIILLLKKNTIKRLGETVRSVISQLERETLLIRTKRAIGTVNRFLKLEFLLRRL